jgi:hypothetical protein
MRKTNPDRAAHLAELLGVMQKDLRRIEVALREIGAGELSGYLTTLLAGRRGRERGAATSSGTSRTPQFRAIENFTPAQFTPVQLGL